MVSDFTRRKVFQGGALIATSATLNHVPGLQLISPAEAAEVKKGMSWDEAVSAFRDDMRRGAVEQSASIARMKDMSARVFNARKGLIASVPADSPSEARALTEVLRASPDTERVGIFHQHQFSAIAHSARRFGGRLSEADEVDVRGVVIKKGRNLLSVPHSSPYSVDDIEHSALDEQYGAIAQQTGSKYDVVHGVFDPLGLWYYEIASGKRRPQYTEKQLTSYERDLKAANEVVRLLSTLKPQFLKILTQALAAKMRDKKPVNFKSDMSPVDFMNTALVVLAQLYNRGIDPSRFGDVQSIMRNHKDILDQIHTFFVAQQKRLKACGDALEALKLNSALQGSASPEDIALFQDTAFDALGVLSRFVPYDDIKNEPPLSGVFKD